MRRVAGGETFSCEAARAVYSNRSSAAYIVYREGQWRRRSKHTETESWAILAMRSPSGSKQVLAAKQEPKPSKRRLTPDGQSHSGHRAISALCRGPAGRFFTPVAWQAAEEGSFVRDAHSGWLPWSAKRGPSARSGRLSWPDSRFNLTKS